MEGDNGYGSAVDKTDELRRNMQQEARHLCSYFWLPEWQSEGNIKSHTYASSKPVFWLPQSER